MHVIHRHSDRGRLGLRPLYPRWFFEGTGGRPGSCPIEHIAAAWTGHGSSTQSKEGPGWSEGPLRRQWGVLGGPRVLFAGNGEGVLGGPRVLYAGILGSLGVGRSSTQVMGDPGGPRVIYAGIGGSLGVQEP